MGGLTGELCVHCRGRLCGHAALLAIVLGYANAPRCPRCFAEVLSTPTAGLLREAHAHIKRRACFSRALAHANAREVGPASRNAFRPRVAGEGGAARVPTSCQRRTSCRSGYAQETWDAGDMSCGDLVLELRRRVGDRAPGEILRVRATDPATPLDIPAWCRLTGNALMARPGPICTTSEERKDDTDGYQLCVNLTWAKNDADKATVAFVVATTAVASEKETMVFLSTEGYACRRPATPTTSTRRALRRSRT